jgi:rhamnulokinase
VTVHAAVDLGASGGRVMAGVVDGDSVRLDEVHRFPNGCVERDGHLRWDVRALFAEVEAGLAKVPEADTIGIDTWGVDYGLLDEDGGLLADPVAHRDDRTVSAVERVHEVVPPEELFAANGLQHLPFTTIYQLAADDLLGDAAHALLIPDLLAHRLTGELATEVTNASTTGLLDVHTRTWSTGLFERLGLPNLFPPLQDPGERRGGKVVTVGSHDTASAVVGVPATTERFAYVCCGTWSLVGVELGAPVVTDAARAANFTNEAGVDGRTRFLRNVGGLWLLQECLRTWGRDDLTALLAESATLPRGPVIDVDDPAFIPPGGMPDRIAAAAGRPLDPVETTRCIVDSLAEAYARTIHQAAALSGTEVDVIHVVGGGAQNDLLCRLTAEAAGLPVLAGPVEATALGNVLVQARRPDESLESLRARLAGATHLRRYDP